MKKFAKWETWSYEASCEHCLKFIQQKLHFDFIFAHTPADAMLFFQKEIHYFASFKLQIFSGRFEIDEFTIESEKESIELD